MSANGPQDQVAWDLDWDDLTEGTAMPPPAQPTAAGPPSVAPATAQPPPIPTAPPTLPRRAFPTSATAFPATDPAPVVAVQRPPIITAFPSTPPGAGPTGDPVRTLIRGQRIRLAEILPGDPPPAFEMVFTLAPATGQSLDLCCFGLGADGKLSDDRYFIFYNQKNSPEGALTIRGTRGDVFGVDLGRLPSTVHRLVFTVTIDGTGSVRTLGASRFELRANHGQAAARYEFTGTELDEVQALMVVEIYAKDGIWRLAAVGQGFAGGLSEVLRHFGGQEI